MTLVKKDSYSYLGMRRKNKEIRDEKKVVININKTLSKEVNTVDLR